MNGGVSYNFDFPSLVVIDALIFNGAHVLPHGAWGARGRDLHRAGRRLAVLLLHGERRGTITPMAEEPRCERRASVTTSISRRWS